MYIDRLHETIASIATAPGSSIGIIRISGENSLTIGLTMTKKKSFTPNYAHIVSLYDNSETIVDTCLLIYFKGPKSFTGEDVIELHLHGSALQARDVLDIVLKAGCEPALNGEFSYRSVIHGKMSLNQAVNLNSLINASDHITLKFSRKEAFSRTFMKSISDLIPQWQKLFTISTALLDFPDDIDSYLSFNRVSEFIFSTRNLLEAIYLNSEKLTMAGNLSVVLAGTPNVGKSSLFNLLTKKDRAIVSEIEGTTRDYISEHITINNNSVELLDTAGIRANIDSIEKIGIEKSLQLIEHLDIVLFIIDSSQPVTSEVTELYNTIKDKLHITVFNKIDLGIVADKNLFSHIVEISVKDNTGVEGLFDKLNSIMQSILPDDNTPVVTQQWQRQLIRKTLDNISSLIHHFDYEDVEIISLLISGIYHDILELTGQSEENSVYDRIFSDFCIGK